MELKNFNVTFFFLLLIGISVLTFFIFQPFLIAILMAAILAVVFQTPFNFFLKITNGHRKVSAFLTSFFGIIIFSALFFGIIGLVANEISSIYNSANVENGISSQKYVNNTINAIKASPLLQSLGIDNLVNKETIAKSFSQISQIVVVVFQKTYQSVLNFLFIAFLMFFTLYYFLISGKDIVKKIMYLSPLRDAHEKMLIEKFISMSRAAINGNLIIALIQGFLGTVLFLSVGIKSAVIWGIAMMFCSLLPGPGTSLIWFPTGIIMLMSGKIWQGIIVLVLGMTIISLIDNFLSPRLIGKDTQMHSLLIFFAILGGISMFGFLGFIIGPIIIALFLALWDIYGVEFKKQLRVYNK